MPCDTFQWTNIKINTCVALKCLIFLLQFINHGFVSLWPRTECEKLNLVRLWYEISGGRSARQRSRKEKRGTVGMPRAALKPSVPSGTCLSSLSNVINKLTRSYSIILQIARVLLLRLWMGFSDTVNLIFTRLYVYHFHKVNRHNRISKSV
jgi:hypothetical protein